MSANNNNEEKEGAAAGASSSLDETQYLQTVSSLMPRTTAVDGKGMWRAWTRVFESASNACLDLLDNCLDAALHHSSSSTSTNNPSTTTTTGSFRGRVVLQRLELNNEEEEEEEEEDHGDSGLNGKKKKKKSGESTASSSGSAGIVILNNSYHPIKPLVDALTVYRTSKQVVLDDDDDSDDDDDDHSDDDDDGDGNSTQANNKAIGENGVGLKHGCATLSDTSFVLTRNINVFSLGVIAKDLQTPQGIYLPSFDFEIDIDNSKNLYTTPDLIKGQREQAFTKNITDIVDKHPLIGIVIAKDMGGGCVITGIDNLVQQFLLMWQDEWEQNDHVFQLVLCNLRNINNNNNSTAGAGASASPAAAPTDAESKDNEDQKVESTDDEKNADNSPAKQFLDKIKELLPLYYINIPLDEFDFIIDGTPIKFCYWQNRLVELTKFHLKIPKSEPLRDITKDNWYDVGYNLRVFCGFDPMRLRDGRAGENDIGCGLYIYSRNRMIKYEPDARHELGISASGTHYNQGLTILVDDANGELPLMPTKDGIAWSEQKGGEAHKANLYAWVGAVTQFFWVTHFKRFKELPIKHSLELMKLVIKAFADPVLSLLGDEKEEYENGGGGAFSIIGTEITSQLKDADLSCYHGMRWVKRVPKHSTKLSIRKHSGGMIQATLGNDTIFKITDERIQVVLSEMEEESDSKKKPTRKRRATSNKKPKRTVEVESDEGINDEEDKIEWNGRTTTRRKRQHPSGRKQKESEKADKDDADADDDNSSKEENEPDNVPSRQEEENEEPPTARKRRAVAPSEADLVEPYPPPRKRTRRRAGASSEDAAEQETEHPDLLLSKDHAEDEGGVPDVPVSNNATASIPRSRRSRRNQRLSPIPEDLIIHIDDSSDEEDAGAEKEGQKGGDDPAPTAGNESQETNQDLQRKLRDKEYEMSKQKIELEKQKMEKIESQREVERLQAELEECKKAERARNAHDGELERLREEVKKHRNANQPTREDGKDSNNEEANIQKTIKILKNEKTYWQKEAKKWKDRFEKLQRQEGPTHRAESQNVTP